MKLKRFKYRNKIYKAVSKCALAWRLKLPYSGGFKEIKKV